MPRIIKFERKLRAVGEHDSLSMVIPRELCKAFELAVGDKVNLYINNDDELVISKE